VRAASAFSSDAAGWYVAETESSSRWTLPLTPSAQTSTRLIALSLAAVGHTSESSAHVVVCSPVAGLHLSEKLENGMAMSVKVAPAGTENLALKQPRLNGIEPPPEHAYAGDRVPEANETRKPVYEGVVVRRRSTSEPAAAAEMSLKVPSALALMKPGADSEGTVATVPSNTPMAPCVHVPVD